MHATALATNSSFDELNSLRDFSSRIGRDPLLAQASCGNTSCKLDGTLWIKASGKWLRDADDTDIFVPVDLVPLRNQWKRDPQRAVLPSRASIETFMHAVLPQRVVAHVHAINAIAWAVRKDGASQLTARLDGLRWAWIPYVASGLPLAIAIERAIAIEPDANVFILANHGLVICGNDSESTADLLADVERRLKVPERIAPDAKLSLLRQLSRISRWRMPADDSLHALGTDAISRRILKQGVLYPCQAIFLGDSAPLMPCWIPFSEARNLERRPYLIVEGSGVLVDQDVTRAELATLIGLRDVVQRIDIAAPVQYLDGDDLHEVLSGEGLRYRASAENNALMS